MLEVIDLISHVRTLNGAFPKREQLVADFVLANLEGISFLSQHEIAAATEVSVATVNRFCTTIGCEGFRDFQIRLAQNVAVSLQYLGGASGDQSETGQLVTQVFSTLVDTLTLVRGQLDSEAIEQATDKLADARRISDC